MYNSFLVVLLLSSFIKSFFSTTASIPRKITTIPTHPSITYPMFASIAIKNRRSLMAILANIGYVILGCVGIVVIFLGILAVVEKKLLMKLLRSRTTRNELYIQKIAKINIENPSTSLEEIDKIAKSF